MAEQTLPKTDSGFLAWSANVKSKISVSPTDFGITAAIATQYGTLHDQFATSYAAATDPTTRGPATILLKVQDRKNLEAYARQVVRQIQGTISVTNEQRQALAITIRDTTPTPTPTPNHAPGMSTLGVTGRIVSGRLKDVTNPDNGGRPAGVAGATIFSHVGESAPALLSDWKWEGNISRVEFQVEFPASVPAGSKVWVTAVWRNPRDETGPAAAPISAVIAGGIPQAA